MSTPKRRGPRALSDILGELFTARGYGRLQASAELEEVWNTAVGKPLCYQTRVGDVRRGVLSVTVSHPTLLEELAAFRKPELLRALRAGTPGTTIHDIRFRVGPVNVSAAPAVSPAPLPACKEPPAAPTKPKSGWPARGQNGSRASGHGHDKNRADGKG
jgi:hypothetical protein